MAALLLEQNRETKEISSCGLFSIWINLNINISSGSLLNLNLKTFMLHSYYCSLFSNNCHLSTSSTAVYKNQDYSLQ